jgi:hypothetical protein
MARCSSSRHFERSLAAIPRMAVEKSAAQTVFLAKALFGGRTRARTWDPLIKRHAVRLDFPREFFQLSQNPIITDQWLTAKSPTTRERPNWRTDASEASGVRVAGALHPVSSPRIFAETGGLTTLKVWDIFPRPAPQADISRAGNPYPLRVRSRHTTNPHPAGRRLCTPAFATSVRPEMHEECHFGVIGKWPTSEAAPMCGRISSRRGWERPAG